MGCADFLNEELFEFIWVNQSNVVLKEIIHHDEQGIGNAHNTVEQLKVFKSCLGIFNSIIFMRVS